MHRPDRDLHTTPPTTGPPLVLPPSPGSRGTALPNPEQRARPRKGPVSGPTDDGGPRSTSPVTPRSRPRGSGVRGTPTRYTRDGRVAFPRTPLGGRSGCEVTDPPGHGSKGRTRSPPVPHGPLGPTGDLLTPDCVRAGQASGDVPATPGGGPAQVCGQTSRPLALSGRQLLTPARLPLAHSATRRP